MRLSVAYTEETENPLIKKKYIIKILSLAEIKMLLSYLDFITCRSPTKYYEYNFGYDLYYSSQ